MDQGDKFLEKKNELFKKGEEKGYISIEELMELVRRFKLNNNQQSELWSEIENASFDLLPAYKIKAKGIKNKQDRIAYCYYICFNKLLYGKTNFEDYTRAKARKLIKAVDAVLKGLNKLEKDVIETYFGLETGELLESDREVIKALGDVFIDQYIDVKNSAFNKIDKPLLKMAAQDEKISDYRVINVSSGSKNCLLFAPFDEKGKQVCGPAILQEKGQGNSTDIGYIGSPGQMDYSFSLYNLEGDKSCLIFYNPEKKARPEIYFCKDYISIGLYYPKLGYHSNLYTFKRNEKIRIETFWEGRKLKTTSIDTSIGFFPQIKYLFPEIKEGPVFSKTDIDYRLYVSEENDGRSAACKIKDDGTVYLGGYSNSALNGLVLKMYSDSRIAIQNYNDDKEDDSFVLYANTRYQFFEFRFKEKDGSSTRISFDPNDALHTLKVTTFDIEGKKETEKIISNPLYSETTLVKAASNSGDDKTNEQKLNELIGLESIKKMIKRLKALLTKNKAEKTKPNLNMFFTGNPGTGKTEVARLLAGILYDNGIVKENKFIEIDRSGLVGRYVGESEKNTEKIITEALGGVLFIDEAYSLYTGWEDKDYGNQVIDKLVKAMEDYKGEICIIFAGYKKEMDKLYTMNQGLASRINRKIDFPNYTIDELKLIAEKFLKDNNYTVSNDGMRELLEIIETRIEDENFSNAREVRNILESVYEIQAERTVDDVSNRNLEVNDFLVYEEEQHIIKGKKLEKIDYKVPCNELLRIANEEKEFAFDERFVEEATVNIKVLDKESNLLGEGTGFFINSDGLIATCAHVVRDAEKIEVVVNIFTAKGKKINKKYDASIIGFDEHSDVGLIKIDNPDLDFTYYRLANADYNPPLLTEVVMGGYPLGGERFSKISLNEGKVQSINKDSLIDDKKDIDRIYVDLTGVPGNSGGGVIEKATGRAIAIYAGASIGWQQGISHTLNFGIHLKYLWNLMQKYSASNK